MFSYFYYIQTPWRMPQNQNPYLAQLALTKLKNAI